MFTYTYHGMNVIVGRETSFKRRKSDRVSGRGSHLPLTEWGWGAVIWKWLQEIFPTCVNLQFSFLDLLRVPQTSPLFWVLLCSMSAVKVWKLFDMKKQEMLCLSCNDSSSCNLFRKLSVQLHFALSATANSERNTERQALQVLGDWLRDHSVHFCPSFIFSPRLPQLLSALHLSSFSLMHSDPMC